MNARRLFKLLLAVLVTAGLTVAPLAAPAAAGQLMTAKVQMADADMGADMPCCPGQQDQKAKDCGSCPLVALCTANLVLLTPEAAGLVDREFSRNAFVLPDDLLIDGLGARPPDHPPRTTV